MSFDLEELFVDVFAPQYGDVALIMVDLPHDELEDTAAWQARRDMARDWRDKLQGFAHDYGVRVLPLATYLATGSHNADLPADASLDGEQITFDQLLRDVTIVMAMTQFSASAPLIAFTHKYDQLRVASMPTVTPDMQETALSADYAKIAEVCSQLSPFFEKGIAVEVTFSTGHKFHWAYGRSEHIGGTVGPNDFSAPDRVVHQDIIYARDSQIVCRKLDFVFAGGARHTVIVDGELQLPE